MARFFFTFSECSTVVTRFLSRTAIKVKRSIVYVDPIWLALIVLASLFGCGGGTVGGAANVSNPPAASVVTTISISPKTASVAVGATQQFQAVATDQNGNAMAGVDFTFFSFSGEATEDNTRLAKGMSAGTATITASASGKSASVSLTITANPPPASVLTQISVSPATTSIQVGQQQSYTAVGYDQFNNVMNGITFTWASDGSTAIAMLNNNVATGVSAGTIHITASASGISSAPASLTVLPAPPALTTIGVTPSASSILIGGTQQLTAVGYDQNGAAMNGIMFTWSK